MTGFGAPCGACKCLRRKCTRGCIFAPYFCHEESAAHFAAIHKVFGASNFSKLLTNLPVSDRCEAAVSISYEALARVQDPVYGCVSHIFALQQQVVNLEAQVAVLKAQAAQNTVHGSSNPFPQEEEKSYRTFPAYSSSSAPDFFSSEQSTTQQQFYQDPNNYAESTHQMDPAALVDYHGIVIPEENYSFNSFQNTRRWGLQAAEDLQSVAFPYLPNS